MEKLRLSADNSMKNIPISDRKQFQKKFVAQQDNLLYRMKWKAHFALKTDEEKEDLFLEEKKENYGFKSGYKPPFIKDLDFQT